MTQTRAIVLVEGPSDQAALTVLATRYNLDLAKAQIEIIAMGGITNLSHYLADHHNSQDTTVIGGLFDAAQGYVVQQALERVTGRPGLSRIDLAALGFFLCEADLEDELMRALGTAEMEALIRDEGELGRFRTFQRQPAQREKTLADHLHRFAGIRSGRKVRYAQQMATRIDLHQLPAPLAQLMAHLCQTIGNAESCCP